MQSTVMKAVAQLRYGGLHRRRVPIRNGFSKIAAKVSTTAAAALSGKSGAA